MSSAREVPWHWMFFCVTALCRQGPGRWSIWCSPGKVPELHRIVVGQLRRARAYDCRQRQEWGEGHMWDNELLGLRGLCRLCQADNRRVDPPSVLIPLQGPRSARGAEISYGTVLSRSSTRQSPSLPTLCSRYEAAQSDLTLLRLFGY
eukprot:1194176-Prorocentrum_minimum.AAC.4